MVDEQTTKENVLVSDLLLGEPVASRHLVERYYIPLSILLRKHFPFVPNEAVEDAAYDALLAVIQSPQNYDAARSSLLTYLYRIAKNKVVDLFKVQKRTEFEIFVGGTVALAQKEENNYRAEHYSDNMLVWTEGETLPPDITQLIDEILPHPLDRQIWDMICEGRKDTNDYAQLLKITHLPLSEQQAEVKRQRERVNKRIRRRQGEFRKRLFGEEL